MPRRNQAFNSLREPLSDHPGLELESEHVSGPFSFLNPTRARYVPSKTLKESTAAQSRTPSGRHDGDEEKDAQPSEETNNGQLQPLSDEERQQRQQEGPADLEQGKVPGFRTGDIRHVWRSRDNRKGRHALEVVQKPPAESEFILPETTIGLKPALKGIWRMMTYYPYWDVSWWVATIFTWGSVVWVINAFFAWLPLAAPSTSFPNESTIGGGVTAFIGATIFEVGSFLLMLEAMNENQTACFGWALDTVWHQFEGEGGDGERKRFFTVKPQGREGCSHSHGNKNSFVVEDGLATATGSGTPGGKDSPSDSPSESQTQSPYMTKSPKGDRTFRWLPTMDELRTHYFRELGFLASFIQLIGASIFWIAGLTSLPGILNVMSIGLTDGIFWVPQILGGSCFVISGALYTIETQPKWYIPAPNVLGWHIGFWNFIGGIGFTLCGALGPATFYSSGVAYQSSLATFWGSWAFLLGSTLQWYESLDKHPVREAKQ